MISEIISKKQFTHGELVYCLNSEGEERRKLFEAAHKAKKDLLGNKVHYRGLIEYSNICSKNCYYCGIRRDNNKTGRYTITDEEVIESAMFAYEKGYGSIVLQAGEISSNVFTQNIEKLIKEILQRCDNRLAITLSLGEQPLETLKRWFDAGASRYLIRIETSNRKLYSRLHPNDAQHSYDERLACIRRVREIGYHVGTGVMIGLPFQTVGNMADDLLFMKQTDIDMCGMGPFIGHSDTPLSGADPDLMPLEKRFDLSLKMIALLRLLMPDINIASTTALQAIDKIGREKGILAGANIIMPNITPRKYRNDYLLYENKPCTDEDAEDCVNCLETRVSLTGSVIGYHESGDSKHYRSRMKEE